MIETKEFSSIEDYTDNVWKYALYMKGWVKDYFDHTNTGKVATDKTCEMLLNNVNGLQPIHEEMKRYVEQCAQERKMR